MGRLCVLAIILLASPTLPREVLVLESSTFPVTLPTVGALDVATCADLNATAADLCTREGIAAAQHDACIDQFVAGLAARRDATLAASGLAALRLRVAYSRDGSSVSAARVGDDELLLRVPTDRYLLAYRLASAARLVARDACAQLQGGPTSLDTRAAAPAAACGRCEKSLFDTLARSAAAEPTVDETGWSLRDGATIRRAFGGRLSRSQCVTPRPELWLDSAALAAGPEGVDTWPRAFWRVTEGSGVVAAGHARDVTGRRRDVACASADAPVRVWLNLTDLTTFGYWELDDHFSTLARHADNEGCADRCVLAASPADATLLVSEHAPSVKARAGQRTVHMSIEAKDLMSAHVGDFDLTMDMSLFSNVPLLWAPLGLRARARALPKPTLADLSSRRLLVWASSNCHRTTWDRYGYAQALQRELGDEFDAAGKCLRNPASAQRDFAPMTRNDSWSHATASGNARQWGLYGQYLFVLSLSNAIEDDNVDEKFFQPFLANSVPVAVVGSAARRLAPGGRGSFVDATQYDSPAHLAAHLRWLRDHPAEYLRFFDYRDRRYADDLTDEEREDEAALDDVSVYAPSALCRLCSCVCDAACVESKRSVSQCGYARTTRELREPGPPESAPSVLDADADDADDGKRRATRAPAFVELDHRGGVDPRREGYTIPVAIDDMRFSVRFDAATDLAAFADDFRARFCEPCPDDFRARVRVWTTMITERMRELLKERSDGA